MFGRSKPAVFKPVPYMRQRQPRRIPRWLVILLVGIAMGAGGLLYVQKNHMPPTLSYDEASQLRSQLEQTTRQRDQFKGELDTRTTELQAARTEASKAVDELAGSRRTVERMQKDLVLFVDALPPDPRAGPVGVRAADFSVAAGKLNYHVVFTRAGKRGEVLKGVMQLLVSGQKAGGKEEAVSVATVPVAIEAYQHMQGAAQLPEGFATKEVIVRVLDAPNGKMIAMRVFRV